MIGTMVEAADDFALLRAWQDGDREAGSELVRRHFQTLYRFFRHKIDECPRDLIQRTFLTCVEICDRLPNDRGFRAFLLGIARNKLLHHVRGRERQARALGLAANAGESRHSPSQVIAARQEQRLLLRGLRMLPLDMQIALELYYWENLKIAEIAAVLDVAPGTIKARLSRAKDRLRLHIAELAQSEDLRRSTVDDLGHWARSLRAAASDAAPSE
jgi:RNA polymerase sigma-70 factor (ECF subfamily)